MSTPMECSCPFHVPGCQCWRLLKPGWTAQDYDRIVQPAREALKPEPDFACTMAHGERRRVHLPRNRSPSVTAVTLLGVALALIGCAFAGGFIVGAGMRLADWLTQ